MRCLLVSALLLSALPTFAKEIHVKQGWSVVIEDAKTTFKKGSEAHVRTTEKEVNGVLNRDYRMQKPARLILKAMCGDGMMIEVDDSISAQRCGPRRLKLVRCDDEK